MVNKDRLIETFLDLVKIDSPTFYEKDVADYILEVMMQLGIEAFTDDSYLASGSNSGNVIVRIPGKTVARPLMLNAHMDTIESTKGLDIIREENQIKSSGTTILGADCKAGLAALIEAARVLREDDYLHGPVEIVFTVAEEKGLLGAKNLDFTKIKAKDCFVFDSGGPVGIIVNQSPTQKNIDFIFEGKAAHAGIEPEKGINAVVAASKAITNMKLGKIDAETTTNVGVIEGGKATNIVPDKCTVKAEARSLDEVRLNEVISQLADSAERAAKETSAKLKTAISDVYKGFKIEENEATIRVAELALKELLIESQIMSSGGGSDANVFNERGIRTVSLSAGYENAHSKNEVLLLDQLEKAVWLSVKLTEIYAGESVECLF